MSMQALTTHMGIAVPLRQANVDTDAIIPKQFLKSIKRSGFGVNLFDSWRYLDAGEPGQDCTHRPINPHFVLNDPRYRGASVLVVDQNFGCGSSREHAPWALADYGFRVLIGKSFADIFYNNCFKNALLPIVLPPAQVDAIFDAIEKQAITTLTIDLPAQKVTAGAQSYTFEIDAFRKNCLMHGLDEIGLTLAKAEKIRAFETQYWQSRPWLIA